MTEVSRWLLYAYSGLIEKMVLKQPQVEQKEWSEVLLPSLLRRWSGITSLTYKCFVRLGASTDDTHTALVSTCDVVEMTWIDGWRQLLHKLMLMLFLLPLLLLVLMMMQLSD